MGLRRKGRGHVGALKPQGPSSETRAAPRPPREGAPLQPGSLHKAAPAPQPQGPRVLSSHPGGRHRLEQPSYSTGPGSASREPTRSQMCPQGGLCQVEGGFREKTELAPEIEEVVGNTGSPRVADVATQASSPPGR